MKKVQEEKSVLDYTTRALPKMSFENQEADVFWRSLIKNRMDGAGKTLNKND